MDQAGEVVAGVLTAPDPHLQRVQREIGVQAGGDLPAGDHPCVHIEHERDVHPPRRRPHIGQIRHPELVGPRRGEVPVDQIRRPLGLGRWPGGARVLVPEHPPQPSPAHQPLHGAARHLVTLAVHLVPHLPGPIDLQIVLPHLRDLLAHLLIPDRPGRDGAGLDGVIGR